MKLVYDVNDKPKFGQLIIFAIQQLLAIMTATLVVPVIIGNGMSQSAALFGAGVGTLVYLLFTKRKSPVFLGSSFAFLGGFAAMGTMDQGIYATMEAAEKLEAEGISVRVIDMHTIKPLDTEILLKAAKETGAIVTTEEHSILGGLGAAVCEYISEACPVPVVRHGVNDEFGRSGKAPLVLEKYGLTPENIVEKCKKAISLKK